MSIQNKNEEIKYKSKNKNEEIKNKFKKEDEENKYKSEDEENKYKFKNEDEDSGIDSGIESEVEESYEESVKESIKEESIKEEIIEKPILPLLSISVIGHVDSGKSTLTGQLARHWSNMDKRKFEKLEQIALELNKGDIALTYVCDKTKEERERGVTINTTIIEMKTEKFRLNFFDCPGHADYLTNTTSGCKQSDLSIIVVPADFVASCAPNGMLETHIRLAKVLGSSAFIICINKLDEVALRNKDHIISTFQSAVVSIFKKFKSAGFKNDDKLIFLPISALKGIGLFKNGPKYDFHEEIAKVIKDENDNEFKILTLEEAIDLQPVPKHFIKDARFRMSISSLVTKGQQGVVYCGKVESGELIKGSTIKFLPSGVVTKIKSIQEHRINIEKACAGLNIGFCIDLKDKSIANKIKSGSVIAYNTDPTFKLHKFYMINAYSLKSGRTNTGIKVGYTPLLSLTSNVPVKFLKFFRYELKVKDSINKKKTNTIIVDNPDFIPTGAKFTAIVYPMKDCFAEKFTDFPSLSRFVCLDSASLVAAGIITDCFTEDEVRDKYNINLADFKIQSKEFNGIFKKKESVSKKK